MTARPNLTAPWAGISGRPSESGGLLRGIASDPCVGPRIRVAYTRSILRASLDVNPVAITVIFSSSPMSSSITLPKMMFASS